MLWLNFLHFYQPANAESYSVHKALDKSYWRLLRLMEEHPALRATWNVSGCLLERLVDEKAKTFLDRLKFLVKSGRIELVGSAAYHGFLPLLPETEIVRQIKTNEKILRKHFGKNFKPAGFFFPEMAYSPVLSKLVKRLGYSWIILDEIAYSAGSSRRPEAGKIYLDAVSGLKVVFRDRLISSAYPPDKIWPLLQAEKKISSQKKTVTDNSANQNSVVILTATDAELYGLRHEDPTAEIEKIVKEKSLRTATLSAFIKSAKSRPLPVELKSSSWESSLKDVKNNRPYRLWQDSGNKIQANLWKLANLALDLGGKFKQDKNFYWHRWHLVRGLASCTFWWASAHDFSKIYGPYAWSPDEIERGLEDLIRSVRSFADLKSKKKKLEAEAIYLKIKKLVWESHWKKHWQKIV